jgi:translation elongation factor EF-Ts
MTQPDPLDLIRQSIANLERGVNGDPTQGTKSLRVVTEDLKTAIDLIRSERATEAAEKRGQSKALGWIFGTNLGAVIGVLILVAKTFFGGG